MNHREQASLDVLQERMTNLISRVDQGFADQRVDAVEQGKKIDEAVASTQRLGIRMDGVETAVSDHKAADELVHKDVREHIESHKKREYTADGRSEALTWVDKAIIRYMLPLAAVGIAAYVALTQ